MLEVSSDATGSVWLPCPKCRDTLFEFGNTGVDRRGRLLVMRRIDLRSTGSGLPTEANACRVFLDPTHGDRSGDRGGQVLDTQLLLDALARRHAAIGAREDTNNGRE